MTWLNVLKNILVFIFVPWLKYYRVESKARMYLINEWADYQILKAVKSDRAFNKLTTLHDLVSAMELIGINGKTKQCQVEIKTEFNKELSKIEAKND